MTLPELIELKQKIDVYKHLLYGKAMTVTPPETKFNIWLSDFEDEQEKLSSFILENEGIEINSTFEALVSSLRDELEFEVAQVLFS